MTQSVGNNRAPTQPSAPSNNPQSQIDSLLNPNSYKNVVGLLMQVLGEVAQTEVKMRKANAQMEVEAVQGETQAAQAQGQAAMAGATADAVGSIAGAVGDGAGAAFGARSVAKASSEHTKYTKEIAAKQTERSQLQSKTGMGQSSALPADKQAYGARLDHEIRELQDERGARVSEHTQTAQNMGLIARMTQGLTTAGSSVAKGQAQATSAAASNTQDLAKQVASDIENNSKSNLDVANQALGINPAQVTVAAVRG